MRALRERPCQHQRRTLMPQGPTITRTRTTRHAPPSLWRRQHSFWGLGPRPSAEVQEAGGGLLPRGAGARSPRKPLRGKEGAQPSNALAEASTRRARCAPYGRGRASGNAVRACLKGQPSPVSAPRGIRHHRRESVGALEQRASERIAQCRARIVRAATGKKAVPPSTPYAHASRANHHPYLHREASATGGVAATAFILGSGASPQRGGAGGRRRPLAAGCGGA